MPATVGFFFGILKLNFFSFKTNSFLTSSSSILISFVFKGFFASGKISEDPAKQSVVTWSITSHWGDFQRVSGRITSDSYHRALDGNGIPDKDALVRPAYGTDYGFLHSESAVNLMAIYQVQETRYKEKRRGGLAGLFGGKKMVEYEVEVDNEVDLSFNLDAKYLPVIYGVAKVDSIPIFVDTLATDVSEIFVAYAICEGEVGGLYDIYIDDNSSVCLDENDFDVRNVQTAANTVDVVCKGRMHRGDTLDSKVVKTNTSTLFGGYGRGMGSVNWKDFLNENPQIQERNMIVKSYHKIIGEFKSAGNPIKMSTYKDENTRGNIPDLDEHREKIIKEFS